MTCGAGNPVTLTLYSSPIRAIPQPFEPACQRQAEPSEPFEPGPRSGPIVDTTTLPADRYLSPIVSNGACTEILRLGKR